MLCVSPAKSCADKGFENARSMQQQKYNFSRVFISSPMCWGMIEKKCIKKDAKNI